MWPGAAPWPVAALLSLHLFGTRLLLGTVIFRRMVYYGRPDTTVLAPLTGVVVLLLWLSVGWAGRFIAFF